MTQSHDLAQDFFAALIDAHSRYKMPASEIVKKTMKYYHLRARYPNTYQKRLHESETLKLWRNQRRVQSVARGKCAYCGRGSLIPGTKMCQKCMEYYRSKSMSQRARWDERFRRVTCDA